MNLSHITLVSRLLDEPYSCLSVAKDEEKSLCASDLASDIQFLRSIQPNISPLSVRTSLSSKGLPLQEVNELCNSVLTSDGDFDENNGSTQDFSERRKQYFRQHLWSSLSQVADFFTPQELHLIFNNLGSSADELQIYSSNLAPNVEFNDSPDILNGALVSLEAGFEPEDFWHPFTKPQDPSMVEDTLAGNTDVLFIYRRLLACSIKQLVDRKFVSRIASTYSWGLLTDHAISVIVNIGPIVEIGSGTGFMASQLSSAGVDIICYDHNPFRALHFDVQFGSSPKARQHSERALMLSWPDANISGNFANDCLEAYEGAVVIYIGELAGNSWYGQWGHTGSERFQTRLQSEFALEREITLPFWPKHRDKLTIWQRKDFVSS